MSTTEVIWITPINQAGWDTTHQLDPKGSVDDFRKKITTVVERYNTNGKYSVVQGKLFNFPVRGDDSAYITAMFGDLLHPTELGYKALYTRGLLTALC